MVHDIHNRKQPPGWRRTDFKRFTLFLAAWIFGSEAEEDDILNIDTSAPSSLLVPLKWDQLSNAVVYGSPTVYGKELPLLTSCFR